MYTHTYELFTVGRHREIRTAYVCVVYLMNVWISYHKPRLRQVEVRARTGYGAHDIQSMKSLPPPAGVGWGGGGGPGWGEGGTHLSYHE